MMRTEERPEFDVIITAIANGRVLCVSKRSTPALVAGATIDVDCLSFETEVEAQNWANRLYFSAAENLRAREPEILNLITGKTTELLLPIPDFDSATSQVLGPLDIEMCRGKEKRYRRQIKPTPQAVLQEALL